MAALIPRLNVKCVFSKIYTQKFLRSLSKLVTEIGQEEGLRNRKETLWKALQSKSAPVVKFGTLLLLFQEKK